MIERPHLERQGRRRARAAALRSLASAILALASAILALALAGCAAPEPPAPAMDWAIGAPEPAFDPDGPPHALRATFERLLTRGLVRADTTGVVRPDAARAIEVSDDSLVYTFRLRPGLAFTDGTRCSSAHFARAVAGGLARRDHATRLWLLAALQGAERVRAGRPLPPLGIETPDGETLVLRLARRDPDLLRKLALPGVSHAWADRAAPSWGDAVGLGPYRALEAEPGKRLVLVAAAAGPAGAPPDTIRARVGVSMRTARALLRAAAVDLLWPIPPELPDEPIGPGYRLVARPADPPRRLLLVMRADLPPTTRLPARSVLAHSIHRERLVERLGRLGRPLPRWFDDETRFDFPRLDPGEAARWMEVGDLGRSFHVDLAYDANGAGALLARPLQLAWAEQSLYVEPMPSGGERFQNEALGGRAHLLLVEAQAPLPGPAAELASLVMPMRGPAVGAFRTGWRTREFDAWVAPRGPAPAFPASAVRERLETDRIVLPIAALPWAWIEREGGAAVASDPRDGPRPAPAMAPAGR